MYIVNDKKVIYQRIYGKGLDINTLPSLVTSIYNDIRTSIEKDFGSYDFFKYKISYHYDSENNLFFILVSGLSKKDENFKSELIKLKNQFFLLFKDTINDSKFKIINEALNPFIDSIHRNLKPKISLVGYSGVGKTTTTRLIKADEIPMQHIATINGEVSTIKIANLNFLLWDFAGQEQFSLLWNSFIRGSDAILIITDSTIENVDKSKFFLELIRKEAPYAHIAVIANKQDRQEAMTTENIENLIGLKTYSMIAIDPENRLKMMQIIADLLEMNTNISPLLKPLVERDHFIYEAEQALLNGDLKKSAKLFKLISDLSLELGEDTLSKEFYQKAQKIEFYLKITKR